MKRRGLLTRIARALTGRGYDAAGGSGRWPACAQMCALPRQAEAARATLAKRAAYLVQNAPIGESIANVWSTNVVGDGPSVRSGHPNSAMRRALESAWLRFYKKADVEGGDLTSMLVRAVRALVTDGECFIRLLTVWPGVLRLQLLPAQQVDASVNRALPDGGMIASGVERGPLGEVRAYWILPAAPDGPWPMIGPAVRVDAADVCHVYEPRFAGQVRGVSWLHAVATRIIELDATEDAAAMKAKVNALVARFIKNIEGNAADDAKNAELEWEPGTLRRLAVGEDITFSPTTDQTGLSEFLKHLARSVASGSGTPYELITGDLSQVNYSSARVGLQNFIRRCRAIRSSILIGRFLQPVWERMVTLEILSGRLAAPGFEQDAEAYFDATFLFPEWASLDPYKETAADVEALNAGLRSRQEIIASRGRDIEDVDAEIAADTFKPAAGIGGAVREVTRVTKHDDKGRILEFERRRAPNMESQNA